MTVHYDFYTGTPRQIADALKELVDEYTQDGQFDFKIGITNDPEARYRAAYQDKYDFMIVIYKSSSHENVKAVEKELINDNLGFSDNKVGGGGGPVGASGPYYTYIVVTPKMPVDTGLAALSGAATGAVFGGPPGAAIGAILGWLASEIQNDSRKKPGPKGRAA